MADVPGLVPPRGMRDFYPADMRRRNAIFGAWTDASLAHGFEPYDACVVESLELLKRKGGEEIVDQIYAFRDKSDRDLALRAEMTPTLARMVAARQGALPVPLKWFAIAQCFRYERMTRGRKREHYQWNLDIVGESGVSAEAEILATALDALGRLGLPAGAVRIGVNHRGLLGALFEQLGIPVAAHAAVFLALDKRGKVDDLAPLLNAAGLDAAQRAAVDRILAIQTLDEAAALLPHDAQPVLRLRELFGLLESHGVGGPAVFDITVIRGLGYYTGIVFEGFDARGELRAVFGGGRYDNLLADLGGRPETAVGLGFGDVVIAELLSDLAIAYDRERIPRLAVGHLDATQQTAAVRFAAALRREGRRVDLALRAEKPKAFFARVSRDGFAEAAYIGPDDVAAGTVRIKDLATRAESTVALGR